MSEPPAPETLSLDQGLLQTLREVREAVQQQRNMRFQPRSRAWLALAPAWTEELAAACAFPTSIDSGTPIPLADFLAQAESAGLCTRRNSIEPDGRTARHFWMPDIIREQTLADLRGSSTDPRLLPNTALQVGQAISAAQKRGVAVSPQLSRWAELAVIAAESLSAAAYRLLSEIQQLAVAENTGEALAWLRIGTALAQALQGELLWAVQIGEHQVDLAYRRAQDKRRLEHFLERQEQTNAFFHLIENRSLNAPWALHYLGMGGVGKTMLLRYITAKLAPELRLPTSRIDFDYLSPDYPVRRPGELLMALADELRLYSFTPQHYTLFESLRNQVILLHEGLSGQALVNPLGFLEMDEFNGAVQTFAELLGQLPAPVILILDTTEELAKTGSVQLDLAATFAILQRVHDRLESVRLIFAGRRLLTREGHDWDGTLSELPEAKAYLREPKRYMLLHVISGFHDNPRAAEGSEVSRFFSLKKLDLPPEMRAAILGKSVQPDLGVKVTWTDGRSVDDEQRYNPFDLNLYADWLLDEPSLGKETITSGGMDPYIHTRIVGRLQPAHLRQVLPAVILLRHFDKPMLRPALDVSVETFEEVYRELGDQEWISYQRDEGLQTTFLVVDRNLYPRLQKFYQPIYDQTEPEERQRERRGRVKEWAEAARTLGPHLDKRVRQSLLGNLRSHHIDAALRALPAETASSLWENLSERVAAEADWSWVTDVIDYLQGEGELSQPTHPLQATVLATKVAATIHTFPEQDISSQWNEVAQSAPAHPDQAGRKWLVQRALVGQVAACRITSEPPPVERLSALWQIMAGFAQPNQVEAGEYHSERVEQLAAALCAALDALLERDEITGDTSMIPDDTVVWEWASRLGKAGVSREVRAFAHCLAGRTLARRGKWREASLELHSGQVLMPQAADIPQLQHWFDWRAPEALRDRLFLEIFHTLPRPLRSLTVNIEPALEATMQGGLAVSDFERGLTAPNLPAHPVWGIAPERVQIWQRDLKNRLKWIDSERLCSAILQQQLDQCPVPAAELEDLTGAERYDPNRKAACQAHRATPPLFISLAQGWLALGAGVRTLDSLERCQTEAERAGTDADTVDAAIRARAHVIRRMRMYKGSQSLLSTLAGSAELSDRAAAWPALSLVSTPTGRTWPQPDGWFSPAMLHTWWASQHALRHDMASQCVQTLAQWLPSVLNEATVSGDDAVALALELDWQEVMIIAKRLGIAVEQRPFPAEARRTWAEQPQRWVEAVCTQCRSFALGEASNPDSWAERIGPRRVAELALEEGELLALRLPAQAVALLKSAHELFSQSGDHAGATIAAIRALIAAIHAREAGDALNILENRVRPSYELLLEGNLASALPGWKELVDWSRATTLPELTRLDDPSWAGWLHRLILCLVWLNRPASRLRLPSRWLSRASYLAGMGHERTTWLAQRYGSDLPLELDLELTDNSPPSTSRLRAGVISTVGVLAGLGITVAAIFYVNYILGWAISWVAPNGIATLPQGLVNLAFWAMLVSGTIFLSQIRPWLAAHTTLRLQINAKSQDSRRLSEEVLTGPVDMMLNRTLWQVRLRPPWLQSVTTQVAATVELHGLQAYRLSVQDMPAELVKPLSRLQEQLRKRTVPIELETNLAAAFPWEATLALSLPSLGNSPWRETFPVWRSRRVLPASSTALASWRKVVVQVVSSPSYVTLAKRGWEPLRARVIVHGESPEVVEPDYPKILHLIGRPVQTRGGVRVDVGGLRFDASVPGDSLQERGGHLLGSIRPENLVVIEAEPAELSARVDTERREAARLRRYAAELFASGVPAVILLPVLPPSLAEEVLKILARGLRGNRPPDLRRYLNTVTTVRKAIADWQPADISGPPMAQTAVQRAGSAVSLADTLQELALDICLFVGRERDSADNSASATL